MIDVGRKVVLQAKWSLMLQESRLSKPWGASQEAAPLHGLCISACLQVPALLEFLPSLLLTMDCYMELSEINPFLSKLPLAVVFHHSYSNPK